MATKQDFIIVGQGIAGSVLALKLLRKGYSVSVFDNPENNISSSVAAGIFNPITGRRMIKTWKADQLWPSMLSFYQEMEEQLQVKLLYPLEHYRPFRTVGDVNDFEATSPSFSPFLKSVSHQPAYPELLHDTFGGIQIARSGYLDIHTLLESVRKLLLEKGGYRQEWFDFTKLQPEPGLVKYGDLVASHLLFAGGWHNNPLFDWLPFRPVKGELLKITTQQPIRQIFNRGVFILPRHNDEIVVGATYEHSDLSSDISQKGKEQLVARLDALLKIPYQIVGQKAGVRPSSSDRRPFVGIHPKYETIGVLNGLGTKGVTLAPHFADELIGFIEKTGEIDSDADIGRFKSLYL